jgi:hypothetical protein
MQDEAIVETTKEQGGGADVIADIEGVEVTGDFEPGPGDVSAPKSPAPEIPTEQLVLMLVGPLFDILAPAWEVTDGEKQLIAAAYAPVIDKYFPDLDLGPELGAVAVTALVFGPRYSKPRRVEKKEEGRDDGDQSKHQPPE